MKKVINIFFLTLIIIFFFSIYKFYSSNQNIQIKKFNRDNLDQIISSKILNLPLLDNDTNNIIEFNDGFSNEIKDNKPRSFWNLLRPKWEKKQL